MKVLYASYVWEKRNLARSLKMNFMCVFFALPFYYLSKGCKSCLEAMELILAETTI